MAQVGGPDGAFSFTSTGNQPANAEFESWRGDLRMRAYETTPAGWTMPRYYYGRLEGTVVATVTQNDSAKAPIPDGVTGTVTLTSSSGQTYSGKATIVRMLATFQSAPDAPQKAQYQLVFSGTASGDAIS